MSDRNSEADESSEDITFEEVFEGFCKVGDRTSEDIALRNIDKWFKQANIFSKEITPTDTAIIFAKIAKAGKRKLTIDEFRELINQLAEEKDIDASELESQLEAVGRPSYSGITKPIRGSIAALNMDRLTNPLKYTGSHKERFDESGKGKGLAGRFDVASADGYVQGYKRSGESIDENKAEKKKSREEQRRRSRSRSRSREMQSMNQTERRKSREEQQMREAGKRKSSDEQPTREAGKRRSDEEQPKREAGRKRSDEEQPMREAGKWRSHEEQPKRGAGKRRSDEEQQMREAGQGRSDEEQPKRGAGKRRSDEEQPKREAGKRGSREEQPIKEAGKRRSREEHPMREDDYSEEDEG